MTSETLSRLDPSIEHHHDALDVLESRRSVAPARLVAPGPDAKTLRRMLTVAARVPDHGALQPWRFVVVDGEARAQLARRLQQACVSAAGNDIVAREQADRTSQKLGLLFGEPPVIVIVISRPDASAKIPVFEQILSAGAVCMNLIAAAASLSFATTWLTGWAGSHPAARPVLGLSADESVAGIIPIGTAIETPPDRPRPDLSNIVRSWGG